MLGMCREVLGRGDRGSEGDLVVFVWGEGNEDEVVGMSDKYLWVEVEMWVCVSEGRGWMV